MQTSRGKIEAEELAELQRAHSKLGHLRQELLDWKRDYSRMMTAVNALQGVLGKRINDLKSTPHEIITDHAIIRYLERYTDYDLSAAKQAIRELPAAEKQVENNNILTVHPPKQEIEKKGAKDADQ